MCLRLFAVLNGAPGYLNILEALNSWQLVKELRNATGLPAATSFKHVTPAGAAIGTPLTAAESRSYMVSDLAISAKQPTLAAACARAKGQFYNSQRWHTQVLFEGN
ncbi:unnamed protein product [Gongylonema pulchrum]|uniref:Phosphoribosylaminoimidazolecarboxamide formyltransferase n=1 Tax=Gongylonema pulchrum TaxID=637853 RepID=A0A183DBW7_9BILA|nr:unnamed protein product [Gongylonema pulchrum]